MNVRTHQAGFQTTRWSLIDAAKSPHPADRRRAQAELAARYQPPVYAFLRRKGMSPDDAADTAQGFFETVVLHRDLFARAEAGSGRLRTLVLRALENYVVDLARSGAARARAEASRGNGASGFRDDEGRVDLAAPSEQDSFDRLWAVRLLERAVDRCREHFVASGRPSHWQVFERRVLGPSVGWGEPPALQRVSEELGFASPADAAAAVQTVKRRLVALVEQVIREECAEDEVADEFDHFRRVLGQPALAASA